MKFSALNASQAKTFGYGNHWSRLDGICCRNDTPSTDAVVVDRPTEPRGNVGSFMNRLSCGYEAGWPVDTGSRAEIREKMGYRSPIGDFPGNQPCKELLGPACDQIIRKQCVHPLLADFVCFSGLLRWNTVGPEGNPDHEHSLLIVY